MKAYIINISFQDITPKIWRKIILPADGTFYRLHQTIQLATNFQSFYEPYHLFEFQIGDVLIADKAEIIAEARASGQDVRQARREKFDHYLENAKEFMYIYDFGDDWRIQISLESIVDDYHFGYPTILDGEHTAPPEDVGGPTGYTEFLKVYRNPKHKDYLTMYQWAEDQQYQSFHMELVNDRLKQVKYKKTDWASINHENYQIIADPYRPSDVINLKKLENKELILQYAIAFGNLYGAIDSYQFVEIYNAQNKTPLSIAELRAFINAPLYKKVLENNHIYAHADRLVHETIEYFGDLRDLLEMSKGKPYYIPRKEELLRYADEFYFEKTKEQAILTKMLAKDFFGGNMVKAYDEVEDLIVSCSLLDQNMNHIIQSFLSRFEWENDKQVKKYVAKVVEIANHVRLWENRGHTAAELLAMEQAQLMPMNQGSFHVVQGGKIGRNDPCPCGSGKKYKKCCGK